MPLYALLLFECNIKAKVLLLLAPASAYVMVSVGGRRGPLMRHYAGLGKRQSESERDRC